MGRTEPADWFGVSERAWQRSASRQSCSNHQVTHTVVHESHDTLRPHSMGRTEPADWFGVNERAWQRIQWPTNHTILSARIQWDERNPLTGLGWARELRNAISRQPARPPPPHLNGNWRRHRGVLHAGVRVGTAPGQALGHGTCVPAGASLSRDFSRHIQIFPLPFGHLYRWDFVDGDSAVSQVLLQSLSFFCSHASAKKSEFKCCPSKQWHRPNPPLKPSDIATQPDPSVFKKNSSRYALTCNILFWSFIFIGSRRVRKTVKIFFIFEVFKMSIGPKYFIVRWWTFVQLTRIEVRPNPR